MMREAVALHQVRSGASYYGPGLDAILDALASPIVVVDRDGTVSAANQAWLDGSGFASRPMSDWAGRAFCAIDPGRAAQPLDDHLAAVLAGGPTVSVVRQLAGGAAQHWQCRITPISDPDRESPVGATIVHTPLTTDQMIAEQSRVACQAKSRFLADLSHEMRTPLNAIIGFADLMEAQALGPLDNPRYRAYAGDIAGCGRHLLDLVNQVLDLARVETGALELVEETVDLTQITHQACDFLGDLAGTAGITLRHIPAPDPIRVRADRRLILQILFNLLSNAQKVTPRGGTITLSAGIDDAGCPWLCVADDGPGIPPDQVARILSQASLTRPGPRGPSGGGAGLGLNLCRGFIERHGGRLAFRAIAGHGTSVVATLPASRRLD